VHGVGLLDVMENSLLESYKRNLQVIAAKCVLPECHCVLKQ